MARTPNTSNASCGNESFSENDDGANVSEDLEDLLKTKEMCRVTQMALNNIVEGITELFQVHADNFTTRPGKGLETAH